MANKRFFGEEFFARLSNEAGKSFRKRKHFNLHKSFEDPCQRLFNAIQPESYIRPHRHLSAAKDELLVAISGLIAIYLFSDSGNIINVVKLSNDPLTENGFKAVEIAPETWHTVIALKPNSILLEVKAGPFDPNEPKDFADWAPDENSDDVYAYVSNLRENL
jgi:cupin fold WbuC family metalloprotein